VQLDPGLLICDSWHFFVHFYTGVRVGAAPYPCSPKTRPTCQPITPGRSPARPPINLGLNPARLTTTPGSSPARAPPTPGRRPARPSNISGHGLSSPPTSPGSSMSHTPITPGSCLFCPKGSPQLRTPERKGGQALGSPHTPKVGTNISVRVLYCWFIFAASFSCLNLLLSGVTLFSAFFTLCS
jgi:hypothetical protein